MEISELYAIYQKHPGVQTDTRKIAAGELFFALKGPNFNGNRFTKQALDAGAAYVVLDEPAGFEDARLLYTADVLDTLQQLALYHRNRFRIPFIAITGSNGKTTTKELIHAVLQTTFKTYTTRGNLNNHIGIPLTLLSVGADAEMAVIEMGANHCGEIADYCRYVRPTHGLITNCGKAHLEGFGGEEGVRRGKGELYDFIRAQGGTLFVMNDYDYLLKMSAGITHVVTYGTGSAAVSGRAVTGGELLRVELDRGSVGMRIATQLVGAYNLPNVLAAVAVGSHFGVGDASIKSAIENYVPSNSRSQMLHRGTNRIILDAYNANPTSMIAAINNIALNYSGKKVLLLGGMMEMGKESLAEHEAVVKEIGKHSWEAVVLVGGDFDKVEHTYLFFPDSVSAAEWYRNQQFDDAAILVKGSRSIQMEKILD
jgi:UDP-N-acetylmuramoyl-tripeptide--D-alanyl-D-alanine ligase